AVHHGLAGEASRPERVTVPVDDPAGGADRAWERAEEHARTVADAARRLAGHPERGAEVRQRLAEFERLVGRAAEDVVGPVRRALLDDRATLPDDRGRPVHDRLGI